MFLNLKQLKFKRIQDLNRGRLNAFLKEESYSKNIFNTYLDCNNVHRQMFHVTTLKKREKHSFNVHLKFKLKWH